MEAIRNNTQEKRNSLLVPVFLFSIIVPLIFTLGPLRFSAYRLVLLLSLFPAVFTLLSGRVGKLNFADVSILFVCVWTSLSYSILHGFETMIETIGMFWIETLGGYLLGRCFVRTPQAFYAVIRTIFVMGLIVLPFAAIEALTGKNVFLQLFDSFGRVFPDVWKDPRWGLDRVQGPFEHPILMGVFFGSFLGPVFFALGYKSGLWKRLLNTLPIAMVGLSSLSSGPLAGMTAQAIMVAWSQVFSKVKYQWYFFAALWVLVYIVIDVLSNRSPFHVLVSYLAFNSGTAYNRIFIFEWGWVNIIENPIFGIGNNEWKRYWFMSSSFDMYWLIPGLRHGIPALAATFGLFLWAFLRVVYAPLNSRRLHWYRLSYISGMIGFFISGWTVHFWNATYVIFFFFIGCGIWMITYQDPDESDSKTTSENSEIPPKSPVYTRFPSGNPRLWQRN